MNALPLFHGTFAVKRVWVATPQRIFSAWADPTMKAQWFRGPPQKWSEVRRSMDFRVGGKIFATLGYPETGVGMVKLFPDQQKEFVRTEPKVYVAVNGLWGRRGATYVRLKTAKKGRPAGSKNKAKEAAAE